MPKSKRKRVVALTKTKNHGRGLKTELIDKIRATIDEYPSLYVFSYQNMRSAKFKDIRMEWKDSRFFLGKNKVMKVALGRNPEEEYAENLSLLTEDLVGNCGVLMTTRPREDVVEFFEEYSEVDYARAGVNYSGEPIVIPAGPLPQFIHSMTEPLRKLGLPVNLKNGTIEMYEPFTVCKKGDVLTPEQCRILTHFEKPLAEFKIALCSSWSDGKYDKLTDVEMK